MLELTPFLDPVLRNSSNAQDAADEIIWNNDKLLNKYLKNRHIGQNTCQCRK